MKNEKQILYFYRSNERELDLMNKEFIRFLTLDLDIKVNIKKIKQYEYKKQTFDKPSYCLYYDNNKKKYISDKPHIKHFKNNDCNIFEYYKNSSILIKIKDLFDFFGKKVYI
jgi:hypothetical protein